MQKQVESFIPTSWTDKNKSQKVIKTKHGKTSVRIF